MTNPVTSLTARIPGTQFDTSHDQETRVYRIRKSMAVVHFDLAAKGQIVFLPEGAELCVVGSSSVAGCFEVLWEKRLYNIFKADLTGVWSTPMKRSRIKPIATFPRAGACA